MPPVSLLLLCMAAIALISGVTGYLLVARGVVSIGVWKSVIPETMHARFMADLYSHVAGYASGLVGGIVLIVWTWRRRGRLRLHI